MKKHLLPFALLLLLITQTKAQTSVYHPFPDSDAIWNTNLAGGIGPCVHDQYSYTLAGDTTINGNAFHKVVIPYILAVDPFCHSNYPYINAGYVGCIRQDTSARRVYVIQPADTTQYLLYDFTLTTGDVAPAVRSFCEETIIKNVDSVLVDGSYRKRWLVGDSTDVVYSYRIIEGIGATSNLLNPCCNRPDAPIYSLTCFQQNGMTLYPNEGNSCTTILSVKDVQQPSISASISPNPAINQLIIHTSSFHNEAVTVSIMNVLGQETSPPAPLQRRGEDAMLDVSGLAAGIYFVEVVGEQERWMGKFVKE